MGSMKHDTKAKEYLTKAKQYEQHAKTMRNQEDHDWQLCLARAYRMLAEAGATRSMFKPTDKGAA
jgi:hypothetical protein